MTDNQLNCLLAKNTDSSAPDHTKNKLQSAKVTLRWGINKEDALYPLLFCIGLNAQKWLCDYSYMLTENPGLTRGLPSKWHYKLDRETPLQL